MKTLLPALLLAGVSSAFLPAQESNRSGADGNEEGVYAFASVVPMKAYKKEFMPVVGASKKRLQLQTPNGVKRVTFGQKDLLLKPAFVTTEYFAAIGELKCGFDNLAQSRRDANYQADLDAQIAYTEDVISELASTPNASVAGQPAGVSKDEYENILSTEVEEFRDRQEEYLFSETAKADTMYLSFEVTPDRDYSDVYAAVIGTHDDPMGRGKSQVFSVENFGDLQKGVPNKVKFKLSTAEQMIRNLEFKFYLYTGEGLPIATNMSGNLSRLSDEELEKLQASAARSNP